jgi:hypothetical protein
VVDRRVASARSGGHLRGSAAPDRAGMLACAPRGVGTRAAPRSAARYGRFRRGLPRPARPARRRRRLPRFAGLRGRGRAALRHARTVLESRDTHSRALRTPWFADRAIGPEVGGPLSDASEGTRRRRGGDIELGPVRSPWTPPGSTCRPSVGAALTERRYAHPRIIIRRNLRVSRSRSRCRSHGRCSRYPPAPFARHSGRTRPHPRAS